MPLHHQSAYLILALAMLTLSLQCTTPSQDRPLPAPPQTRTVEIIDTVHGVPIPDPYRWLEDSQSDEVQAWAEAQNHRTRRILDNQPHRQRIRDRLDKLYAIGSVYSPIVRGQRLFYEVTDGIRDQAVLQYRRTPDTVPETLIDPNTWSEDGTVALDWFHPSRDGKLIAYGRSEAGSELSVLHVVDVESREALPDVIGRTRAASIAWLPDNSGFYYTRYPGKGEVPEGDEAYYRHVYFHTLGSDPADDKRVWGEDRDKAEWPNVELSEDGRWLVVNVYIGTSQTEAFLLDRQNPSRGFVAIVERVKAVSYAYFLNNTIHILTNHGAPKYRVMRADPERSGIEHWDIAIPEGDWPIDELGVHVAAGQLAIRYLERASTTLKLYNPMDGALTEINLPELGTVEEIGGDPQGNDLFFSFDSYFVPPTLYRYRTDSGTLDVLESAKSDIDTSPYKLNQLTFNSKDGTPVTMFVVHGKDLKRDGGNPTMVYGYGGFNNAKTPVFSRNTCYWLENGGVYATVNLRGGNEYGEEWHKGGMLANKQNSFDDMIAACEHLIAEGYTNTEKLAIIGGSNGGLMVGAVLTQRPDLVKAVVCQVPLLDMVRYHKFLIARLWIPEYGSADDPEQFEFLHAYSPYHHVTPGASYPATLITTADFDTRVEPLHARKMAALLQAESGGDAPMLLRVEKRAGHGKGTSRSKSVELYADVWTFVMWQLGMVGGS